MLVMVRTLTPAGTHAPQTRNSPSAAALWVTMRRRLLPLLTIVLPLAIALPASPASAAYKGKNGELAWESFASTDYGGGPPGPRRATPSRLARGRSPCAKVRARPSPVSSAPRATPRTARASSSAGWCRPTRGRLPQLRAGQPPDRIRAKRTLDTIGSGGRHLHRVTRTPAYAPTYSPDGTEIAFLTSYNALTQNGT
jgi:hypothetical protein